MFGADVYFSVLQFVFIERIFPRTLTVPHQKGLQSPAIQLLKPINVF